MRFYCSEQRHAEFAVKGPCTSIRQIFSREEKLNRGEKKTTKQGGRLAGPETFLETFRERSSSPVTRYKINTFSPFFKRHIIA